MTYEYLPLSDEHQWKAKPNHRILVLDRGALRFDYPDAWIVSFENEGVTIHDQAPPADKCRIVASCRRVGGELAAYPLSNVLEQFVANDGRSVTPTDPIVRMHRPPMELAWTELHFSEPTIGRRACSRICVARSGYTQGLISFDFWPEDADFCHSVWQNLIETLEVGVYIDDPTTGRRRELRG